VSRRVWKLKIPPVASEDNVNLKPDNVRPVFDRRYLSAVERNVVSGTTLNVGWLGAVDKDEELWTQD